MSIFKDEVRTSNIQYLTSRISTSHISYLIPHISPSHHLISRTRVSYPISHISHPSLSPQKNSPCNAFTALGTSSCRITNVRLIFDPPCEINSTFTPAEPSAVNTLAAIPLVSFIPSPTTHMTARLSWISTSANCRSSSTI